MASRWCMAKMITGRSPSKRRCTTLSTPGACTRWRGSRRRGNDLDSVGVGPRVVDPTNFETPNAGDVRLDGSRAATLEQIDAEMVVVSVPAEEPHYVARLCGKLHAHRLVESLASIQVTDVEMHVTEHRRVRKLLLWFGCDSQQPLEIEVLDADVQLPVRVGPIISRPVSVDLDAIALRVVEIEGL